MEGNKKHRDQLLLDIEPPNIIKEVKIIDGKKVVSSVVKASKYISSLLF